MEDDSLLDDEDIIIKETQEEDPTTLSKNLIKKLGICKTTTEAETAEITKYYRENNGDLKKLQETLANAKKPRPADPMIAELEASVKEAEKPIPQDYKLAQLKKDAGLSEQQKNQKRLTAAQDIAWAIINTPAFLFNR